MVYISCKNIKTKRLSNKLDHIQLGLFPITNVLGKVIYTTQTSQRKTETPCHTTTIRRQQRRQIGFGRNPRQQIG